MRTIMLLLATAIVAMPVMGEPCVDSVDGCGTDENPSALMLLQARMEITEDRKALGHVDRSEEHKMFFEGLREKRAYFEQAIKKDANISPDALAALSDFEDFLAANDRDYHSLRPSALPEYIKRLNIFVDTKKKIAARNAHEIATNTHPQRAQHGITKYADWSEDEFKALLGYKGKHSGSASANAANTSLLESFVPCTKNYASRTSIRNQGSCGNCWTFSTATTMRAAYIQQHGVDPGKLSTQFITDCMTTGNTCYDKHGVINGVNGCCGGDPEAAMEWIAKVGGIPTQAAYGDTYASLLQTDSNGSQSQGGPVSHAGLGITYSGVNPNTRYPCKTGIPKAVTFAAGSSPRLMTSESEMASWVCGTGVVSVLVDANLWQTYTSGVMTATSCGTTIDHAVTLIGMDAATNSWIIQNSWGSDWGVNLDGSTRITDTYSNCPSLASTGCDSPPCCNFILANGVSMKAGCALSCSGAHNDGGYIYLQYGQNTCGVMTQPYAATNTMTASGR